MEHVQDEDCSAGTPVYPGMRICLYPTVIIVVLVYIVLLLLCNKERARLPPIRGRPVGPRRFK